MSQETQDTQDAQDVQETQEQDVQQEPQSIAESMADAMIAQENAQSQEVEQEETESADEQQEDLQEQEQEEESDEQPQEDVDFDSLPESVKQQLIQEALNRLSQDSQGQNPDQSDRTPEEQSKENPQQPDDLQEEAEDVGVPSREALDDALGQVEDVFGDELAEPLRKILDYIDHHGQNTQQIAQQFRKQQEDQALQAKARQLEDAININPDVNEPLVDMALSLIATGNVTAAEGENVFAKAFDQIHNVMGIATKPAAKNKTPVRPRATPSQRRLAELAANSRANSPDARPHQLGGTDADSIRHALETNHPIFANLTG